MKPSIIFCSLALIYLLFSCQLTEVDKNPDNWEVVYKNGNYGYLTPSGRVMIDYKFGSARKFIDKRAIVSLEDDLYYLIDTTGMVISKGFDRLSRESHIEDANFYYAVDYKNRKKIEDGITISQHKRYRSLINHNGEVLGSGFKGLKYSVKADLFIISVTCDTCKHGSHKKYGLLDREGKQVGDWFTSIKEEEHFFVVQHFGEETSTDKFSILDFTGTKIMKQYKEVEAIKGITGFYKVGKTTWSAKYAIIDSLGKECFEASSFDVQYYPSQQIFDIEYKRYGRVVPGNELRNNDFEILRNKENNKDYYFPEKSPLVAISLSSKSYGYFKVSDSELINVGVYDRGYVFRKKQNIILCILTLSDMSTDVLRYDIPHFKNSYSKIFKNGKSGAINLQGEVVVKPICDSISILATGKVVSYQGDSVVYYP